ncbi:MAG: hypothetical protein K0S65_5163 [Labilithrix sp.]|nr:hypothetical protein [Labilithrix sp.]
MTVDRRRLWARDHGHRNPRDRDGHHASVQEGSCLRAYDERGGSAGKRENDDRRLGCHSTSHLDLRDKATEAKRAGGATSGVKHQHRNCGATLTLPAKQLRGTGDLSQRRFRGPTELSTASGFQPLVESGVFSRTGTVALSVRQVRTTTRMISSPTWSTFGSPACPERFRSDRLRSTNLVSLPIRNTR